MTQATGPNTRNETRLETLQLRDATEHDSSHLAILADAASRRLVSWLWDQTADDGQSSFDVGRSAIRSDSNGLTHYTNWAVAELGGAVAGGLNSYRLGATETPAAEPLSSVLGPLNELKSIVAGTWYVSVAAVFPEYQGRGIGQELLALAERKALDADVHQLTLMVGSSNPDAHRLYQRVGFREWDRRPFNPFPGADGGGQWILMVKDL